MIEQQGRVVDVLPSKVCIEVGPAQGCERCASGEGCGAGLFVRLINRKPTRLILPTSDPLETGQSVTIGIPEHLFLRWVARLYGLPLAAAFAVAIPVQWLAGQLALGPGLTDLVVMTGAVSGFVVMLLILRRDLSSGLSGSSLHVLSNSSSEKSAYCPAGD